MRTYDRDFGELVFNQGLVAPLGIVYSRLGRSNPELLARRILELIEADRVANNFIVVNRRGERIRALPARERN